jgi:CIC family chloride channel protein
VVRGSDSIAAVSDAATDAHAPAVLVRIPDGSWYAMTIDELTGAAAAFTPDTPVERAIKADRLPILFPDLPLDNTLPYFPRWPLLPVMNRASRGTLEGVVTLTGVLKRYQSI